MFSFRILVFVLCSGKFGEAKTSKPREECALLTAWEERDGEHVNSARPPAELTAHLAICQGQKWDAVGMINRTGPLIGCIFLFKEVSSC